MAEAPKLGKIALPAGFEATVLEQEKSLEVIKRIRGDTKLLGEDTKDLDAQIDIAERIIKSSKDAIARIKAL